MADIAPLPEGFQIVCPSPAQIAANIRDNALLNASHAVKNGATEAASESLAQAQAAQELLDIIRERG